MRNCKTLISKSVRLSSDQVDFIESQPGSTFTEKLSGILAEYKSGDAKRAEDLKYYDRMIAKKRKELQHFSDLMMTLSNLRRESVWLESKVNHIVEELKDALSDEKNLTT